jgi:hypothetical protein
MLLCYHSQSDLLALFLQRPLPFSVQFHLFVGAVGWSLLDVLQTEHLELFSVDIFASQLGFHSLLVLTTSQVAHQVHVGSNLAKAWAIRPNESKFCIPKHCRECRACVFRTEPVGEQRLFWKSSTRELSALSVPCSPRADSRTPLASPVFLSWVLPGWLFELLLALFAVPLDPWKLIFEYLSRRHFKWNVWPCFFTCLLQSLFFLFLLFPVYPLLGDPPLLHYFLRFSLNKKY